MAPRAAPLRRMADDRGAALSVRLAQPGPIPLDAAFDCAPGQLLALVGPSGSGKTTVLRSIAGLYRPLEGRVACGDEIWFDASTRICRTPQRRSVGLVFQNYALFPHLSALANVAAALGHRPPGDRNARARELLELVHLGGLEARLPSALSGGQQQRVAVARALARDPQVLLMDEPFSAVDRVTRQKLYRELAELRRALKMPLVLVTHDLDEAASLADRMCILYRGRTLQIGSPDEIMSRPDNALIARLVDLRNVFEGKVLSHEGERGRTLLQWQVHTLELPYTPQYAVGSPVCWAIPAASVVLHRLDRPSRNAPQNALDGIVANCVSLGQSTSLDLQVDGAAGKSLYLSIPTHLARRNGIAIGQRARVSLLVEGIHLMPWEDLREHPTAVAA
jgi:molybdate transport system ATP-binding protein